MLHWPSLNISADGRRAGPPRPPHPPSTPRVWFQPPFPPIQRQNLAFTLTLPPLLERSGSGSRTPCSISWDTEPRGALRCARTLAHARRREIKPRRGPGLCLPAPCAISQSPVPLWQGVSALCVPPRRAQPSNHRAIAAAAPATTAAVHPAVAPALVRPLSDLPCASVRPIGLPGRAPSRSPVHVRMWF